MILVEPDEVWSSEVNATFILSSVVAIFIELVVSTVVEAEKGDREEEEADDAVHSPGILSGVGITAVQEDLE